MAKILPKDSASVPDVMFTLLALVSAFAGRDLILDAFREAVRKRYRFFSYGDCMLIL